MMVKERLFVAEPQVEIVAEPQEKTGAEPQE
jgi:hypothetical protein